MLGERFLIKALLGVYRTHENLFSDHREGDGLGVGLPAHLHRAGSRRHPHFDGSRDAVRPGLHDPEGDLAGVPPPVRIVVGDGLRDERLGSRNFGNRNLGNRRLRGR